MVKKRSLAPLPVYDQLALIQSYDIKPVHLRKIYRALVWQGVTSFTDIAQIPLKLQEHLTLKFVRLTSRVKQKLISLDGTIKLLVELQDGHEVEAVIMRHQGRNTLCVSSQVGCQMGCTFCATGTMGIIGDLWAGEILEQVVHANEALKEEGLKNNDPLTTVRNVVFMGMGEPLMNYDAVLMAIRGMTELFNIAPKYITLSTVGVIHRIRQLKKDAPLVRLALSLHAPTQEMRLKIVPSSKAFPLPKLMEALDGHLADCQRNELVFIEYVLLEGVNDSEETAHTLGKLLQNKKVHVNLIPYNTTDVDDIYQSPTREAIALFHGILREQYKLKATIRENHGQDIDGACGQLAVKKLVKKKSKTPADIEDLIPKATAKPVQPKAHVEDTRWWSVAAMVAVAGIVLYQAIKR